MSELMTHQRDDVLIVDFVETSILDQDKVDSVGSELKAIPDQNGIEKILVDMNRVDYMSSAMIGEFIQLEKKCKQASIALKLCNMSHELNDLFKVTRLDQIFAIYSSKEEALHAFEQ